MQQTTQNANAAMTFTTSFFFSLLLVKEQGGEHSDAVPAETWALVTLNQQETQNPGEALKDQRTFL